MVAPGTLERYQTALSLFFAWALAHDISFTEHAHDMDRFAAEYIDILWEEGDPRGMAEHLISGFSHFSPALRGAMKASWRLLGAWKRHEPSQRAHPLSPLMVRGLAGLAIHWQAHDVAISLVLCFHALLRTGELFLVQWRHITVAPNFRRATLLLPWTKTGRRTGQVECVTVEDVSLVRWLAKEKNKFADYDFLVRRSAKSWRQVFPSLCDALGLENLMPYGLRRGGATWLFQQTGNWHLVMEKGRWGHVATAKLYVMPALAAMRDDTLSPHTRELLTAAAVQLQRLRLQLEDRCLEQVGR